MTPRTPSSVPFTILIGVAAALAPFLGNAIAYSNTYWASALLFSAAVLSAAMLLLLRRIHQFPIVGVAALWLVPVMILAVERSLLVVFCAIPMLAALQRYFPNATPPPNYALLSAILIQVALVLQFSGRSFAALFSLCIGLALILWAKEPSIRPINFRFVSAVAAILITIFLLSPGQLLTPGQAAPRVSVTPLASTSNQKGSSANAHLGLIFRPKLKAVERKLPPPPTLQPQVVRNIPATAIDIPFSGFYGLFQVPLMAPPENSPVIEGSPGEGKYRSDDTTPVRLEAHQSFNSHFPTRRLASIEVTLLSTDT